MTTSVMLVPSHLELRLPERDDIGVVPYDVNSTGMPVQSAAVFVAWQNSADNLQAASRLSGLRLVQTLAAGPDAVLAAGFPDDVVICSGRSLHDSTVAEHALTMTLAAVRRTDTLLDAQRRHEWDDVYRAAQENPRTAPQYTLYGARTVVLGFGSIAKTLTPLLQTLGASVRGVARTARTQNGVTVYSIDRIADAVRKADVVISLLPATAATERIIDASLLAELAPHAVFINVGRGSTVDENALDTALRSGQLRAAALDVFTVEPLPADSMLWTTPNLLITPHVAGNRPRGAEALIEQNLDLLRRGDPLVNVAR